MSTASDSTDESPSKFQVISNWYVTAIVLVLTGIGGYTAVMALVWMANYLWVNTGGCN